MKSPATMAAGLFYLYLYCSGLGKILGQERQGTGSRVQKRSAKIAQRPTVSRPFGPGIETERVGTQVYFIATSMDEPVCRPFFAMAFWNLGCTANSL